MVRLGQLVRLQRCAVLPYRFNSTTKLPTDGLGGVKMPAPTSEKASGSQPLSSPSKPAAGNRTGHVQPEVGSAGARPTNRGELQQKELHPSAV